MLLRFAWSPPAHSTCRRWQRRRERNVVVAARAPVVTGEGWGGGVMSVQCVMRCLRELCGREWVGCLAGIPHFFYASRQLHAHTFLTAHSPPRFAHTLLWEISTAAAAKLLNHHPSMQSNNPPPAGGGAPTGKLSPFEFLEDLKRDRSNSLETLHHLLRC